jgi:hypothetical protein
LYKANSTTAKITQAKIPTPKAGVKPVDGKKKPSHAREYCGEKKYRGCDRQPVRSEHSAYNNQSTSDCDKSDNDVQNCESPNGHS